METKRGLGKGAMAAMAGVAGLAGILGGCGGGGGAGSGVTSVVASAFSEFPLALAISSPLDITAETAVAMRERPATFFAWAEGTYRQVAAEWRSKSAGQFVADAVVPNAYAAAKAPRYTWATLRIQALLDGTASPTTSFDPSKFLMQGNDAACYGPLVVYQNNPDSSLPNAGTLPTGDVGMWRELDDTATGGTSATGMACASAQLNARMKGVSWRTNQGLMGLAILLRRLYATGGTLPAAGASTNLLASMPAMPNVTWTSATIDRLNPSTYHYTLELTWVDTVTGYSHPISVNLYHTPGADATHYVGLMTYTVGDKFMGGNCGPTTLNDVTVIGTLQYNRAGLAAMTLAHRQGQYCGGTVSIAGKQDSSGGATNGLLLPTSGWADNFSRLGATYDPTTLGGSYLYVWQAGSGDGNSRVMQLRLTGATSSGEAYYGYGDSIQTTGGSISGMICNWAGPGNTHNPLATEYAQRQSMRWNSVTELWEVGATGSDIRYAPTNTCLYDGTGSFKYDRNLNGSFADEVLADWMVTNTGAATDLDLLKKGGSATIQGAINALGYTPPSIF